ncbi:Clathrin light chain [Entomophthora muscae]|uniref:Clathrin light chain n=1 Tax=Entomophthora muscae TaxID=34485 RepID=A0ACC2RKB5_9FUNG|nr:Clathrin light chain [Entomophthora muscae]
MAEFGDFSTSDFNGADFEVEDPTADFLAREKAILGEDTDFLATTTKNDSSFTDPTPTLNPQDIPLPESSSSFRAASYDFGVSAPLSNKSVSDGGNFDLSSRSYSHTQTFASPPASSSSNQILADRYPAVSARSAVLSPIEDSEFLRNWRIQFQDRLGDRDRREEEKHAQILAEAKIALEKAKDDYLSARKAKLQSQERITSNQNDGCDGKSGWSLVSHLASAKQGQKDTSRLIELIQKLTVSGHSPQVK